MNTMRCIVCGCTEDLPCPGQNTETGMCFWVFTSEMGQLDAALCSACATKPVDEIERRLNGVVA